MKNLSQLSTRFFPDESGLPQNDPDVSGGLFTIPSINCFQFLKQSIYLNIEIACRNILRIKEDLKMRKVFFILLLLSSMSVFAQTKTFIREYTYQASDYDSKVTARVNTLEEVKRLLLEEVAVFMQSEFEDNQWEKRIGNEIESGETTEKRLISITAGITQTEIIEETWNGVEYWLKAKITIDPEEMKKQLDLILQDREKTSELEEIRNIAFKAKTEIDRLKIEIENVKYENEYLELEKQYLKNNEILSSTDYLEKGISAFNDKDYVMAILCFKKAIELNPEYARAYNGLGVIYKNQGDYSTANKYYKKALELDPEDIRIYNNLGILYEDQGDYSMAKKYYEKVIELDPEDASAYCNLGIVNYKQGNYTDAIKWYKRAIEIDPNYSGAYNNLGIVYTDQENYADAITCCKKAIEINPNDSKAYNTLGGVYNNLENYTDATKNYLKAIEINPNNWKPYRNIGNVYRIQSNYSDAIKYLKKSIKINPDNSEAHLNLGLVYNEQRNYLGMIECWQKSARLGNIDAQNALKEIGQKW